LFSIAPNCTTEWAATFSAWTWVSLRSFSMTVDGLVFRASLTECATAAVRNWEFQRPVMAGFGGEVNPLKLLRRRSSLVVDDLPPIRRNLGSGPKIEAATTSRKPLAPAPPAFQEPDAASLLDSFGL